MLISRGTAPEQPVEWAYSPRIARRVFTNFKNFTKFANFGRIWIWIQRSAGEHAAVTVSLLRHSWRIRHFWF